MRGNGKFLDASSARMGRLAVATRIRPSLRGAIGLTVLGMFFLAAGNSQVPQYNGGLPGVERNASGFAGLPENANPRPDGVRALRDSLNQQDNLKQFKALNIQRQKEMNVDTGKMLTLANEVKAQTSKPGKAQLTVLDLRKVEMIEKLAKSVREKMMATVPSPE